MSIEVEGPVKHGTCYLWRWLVDLELEFLDTSPGRNLRGVKWKS